MFVSDIEKENNFINRIKNKVKVLQMYSSAPANDIYYFGGSFDSSDYTDFTAVGDENKLPYINNGKAMLPTTSVSSWLPRRIFIDREESNGTEGNNHAVYSKSDETGETYRYYFLDSPTSRNVNNIIDNNPLTYFEYEQINVLDKNPKALNFEFSYMKQNSSTDSVQLRDWSTFTADPLKMTLTMESDTPQKANFIKVIPFFGNGGYISKDVVVKQILITDSSNREEDILNQSPIYISSSFIPSSVESARNFYYREANIKFSEKQIKKIKIYFEQANHVNTEIQHLYYKPQDALSTGQSNPYKGQERFNPTNPSVDEKDLYPNNPWSNFSYSLSSIIPSENSPNVLKALNANNQSLRVKLSRQVPEKSGNSIKINYNGKIYYISEFFYREWNPISKSLKNFDSITSQNSSQYLVEPDMKTGGIPSDGVISDSTDVTALSILGDIVNWFNTTTSQGSPLDKYKKLLAIENTSGITISSPAAIDPKANSTATKYNERNIDLNLSRQYERYKAERRSISLRDITVGYEQYVNTAEIISRRFDTSHNIDYLTISSETEMSGDIGVSDSNYIKYYISVDNGSNWTRISNIESDFSGIPEVIAFNQNVDDRFKLPGVEYINYPVVPQAVNSIIVKIVLTKPEGSNVTPIVYSYKVGAKVRKS